MQTAQSYLFDSDGSSESPQRPKLWFQNAMLHWASQAYRLCPEQMLSLFSAMFEAVAFPFLSLAVKIQLQPLTVNNRINAPLDFKLQQTSPTVSKEERNGERANILLQLAN